MVHSKLVSNLIKPGADIVDAITPHKANFLHCAIGIMGEVVELIEGVFNNDTDNIIEELGDIEFYFEASCQEFGFLIPRTDRNLNDDCFKDLLTQANEFLDLAKKSAIYDKEVNTGYVREVLITIRQAMDECHDILYITYDEAVEHNIGKLSKRYESGKYSDQQAQARSDKS